MFKHSRDRRTGRIDLTASFIWVHMRKSFYLPTCVCDSSVAGGSCNLSFEPWGWIIHFRFKGKTCHFQDFMYNSELQCFLVWSSNLKLRDLGFGSVWIEITWTWWKQLCTRSVETWVPVLHLSLLAIQTGATVSQITMRWLIRCLSLRSLAALWIFYQSLFKSRCLKELYEP